MSGLDDILGSLTKSGGKESGDELVLSGGGKDGGGKDGGDVELVADLQWTYPLSFALVVSGDGEKVFQERIDLSDTQAFGQTSLKLSRNLQGRRWVRLEVWDIAANGAFTQPVWLRDE